VVVSHNYPSDPLSALIECGLTYVRQALYGEAWAVLSKAREGMASKHNDLLGTLDAVLAGCAHLRQAQQELLEASRRFAYADTAQQSHIDQLHLLLSALGDAAPAGSAVVPEASELLPPLAIRCFDQFAVRRGATALELCTNRNGRTILRYLIAQQQRRATADALMEALWPDDTPEAARHKLHIAASALRSALNKGLHCAKGGGYLLYEDGVYLLNPEATIATDVERFLAAYRAGQQVGGEAALEHYRTACRLYSGPFLAEDLYADWSLIQREQLAQAYTHMCRTLADHALDTGQYDDAIAYGMALLAENRCDEDAYRVLIAAHSAAGRRAEALRHYRRCAEVLRRELGIDPAPETAALLERAVGQG